MCWLQCFFGECCHFGLLTLGSFCYFDSYDQVYFFLDLLKIIFRFYVNDAEKNSAALSIISLKSMMLSSTREVPSEVIEGDRNTMSVSFKIFLNYLQMIAIVTSFDMKWPFYTRNFFAFQGVGSYSSDFFSLECLVKRKKKAIFNR